MFTRLGRFATRHYWKIILAWLVVLLMAVPALPHLGEVISYQDSEMLSASAPSKKAQEVVDAQFSVANSSIVIVMTAANVTDESAKDFTLMVESDIANATADGTIVYVQSVTSIYSLYRQSLEGFARMAGEGAASAVRATNLTASALFGIPLAHLAMRSGIEAENPGLNDSQLDAQAAVKLKEYVVPFASGMPPDLAPLAGTYADFYLLAWNATGQSSSDRERMLDAYPSASGNLIQVLQVDAATKAFFGAVATGLSFETWNAPKAQEAFALGYTAHGLAALLNSTDVGGITDFVTGAYGAWAVNRTSEFASAVIANGTIDSYPQLLPDDVVSSFVNPDRTTSIILVTFTKDSHYAESDGKPITENVKAISEIVDRANSRSGGGIDTYITGNPALELDMQGAVADDLKRIDPVAVLLVLVILGSFYRSVVTPLAPLAIIGLAFLGALGILYIVGTYLVDVHYMTMTLLLVIMVAVGVDYCIFLLTRYREERMKGQEKKSAIETAVQWGGESITTSGVSVIIAFGALSLARFSMLKSMGMVVGLGILTTLAMALTLLPSLLMVAGDWMFWPTKINPERLSTPYTRVFRKASSFSIRHAKAIVIAALLVSIPVIALIAVSDTSYDYIATMPDTESTKGLSAMASGFGAGEVMQTSVVMEFPTPVVDGNGTYDIGRLDAVEAVCSEISALPNVKRVTSITRPFGAEIPYSNLSGLNPILAGQYALAMSRSVGRDARYVLVTVTLSDGPFTDRSFATLEDIENVLVGASKLNSTLAPEFEAYSYWIAGSTASMRDVSDATDSDFALMAVVVIVGEFIALFIFLRSPVIPIRSILTIALSIVWTLAATYILFQYLLGYPVGYMLPMILFVILLGLGMDYDILIVTRIREEVVGGLGEDEAIINAVERTGGIITVCGLIMGSALGTLMLSSSMMMKQFGFALFFGVLLDAMVVRIFLVPAIMSLLGKWNWWAPKWMGRRR